MKKPKSLPPKKSDISEPAPEQSPELAEIAGEIERQIGPILQTGQKAQVISRVISIVKEEVHRGPIPAPRTLEQYERVLPGAADRIIRMAEASLAAQIDLAKAEQADEASDRRRGMYLGWSALVLILVSSLAAAFLGQAILATTLVGVGVLSVVIQFIRGRNHNGVSEKPETTRSEPPK